MLWENSSDVNAAVVALAVAAAPSQARDWVVDGGSAAASDSGPGTAATPLKTIGAAAKAAQAGDRVVVHDGGSGHVYRERVAPASGDVVYTAAPGHHPTVRGSEPLPAASWTRQRGPQQQVRDCKRGPLLHHEAGIAPASRAS